MSQRKDTIATVQNNINDVLNGVFDALDSGNVTSENITISTTVSRKRQEVFTKVGLRLWITANSVIKPS